MLQLKRTLSIAGAVAATMLLCGGEAAAMEDHAHHHTMHAPHGGAEDEHAHHRAMLNQSHFRISRHAYQPADIRLIAMDGEQARLPEALDCGGKPVMANFIFTTCTNICPVMSATFAQVRTALGPAADELCMVSITIDPAHDTPERLQAYAQRFRAGSHWQFYTGAPDQIIAAQKAFDVYRGNKMNHEPTTLMRRAEGEPWIRIDGLASADELVRAYREMMTR